jgi:hypothetical protein
LASILTPFGKEGSIIPPLEKGGEGGFEKAIKDRRDMELFIINKISPDPSLLKRGTQLVPDICIIPLWKREILSPPPLEKGRLFSPLFPPHYSL